MDKIMFAKSVLVTGCNRGLGLEFVKQLAGGTQHLFAACRKPDEATELMQAAEQHKHITLIELDVTNVNHIEACADTIKTVVGDEGLNCIINNAGIMSKRTIKSARLDELKLSYAVNAIAPAMIVKTHLPLLRKASKLSSHGNMSVQRASILNMSAILASITKNAYGGTLAYCMSKSALNMLTKNLSTDLKRDHILVASLHPGWVQTDMGGRNAPISVTQSVEGLLKLASGFTEKDNGAFYGWDGEKIPW